MKKLLSLLLAAFMVFSLVACSSSDTPEEPEEPSGQEETPETPDDTAEEKVPEEEETEPDSEYYFADNVLVSEDVRIEITDYRVIPVGEEGNEYGDVPVIAFWYNVTNLTGNDNVTPIGSWIAMFTAIQDNDPNMVNELDVGSLPDDAYLDTQMATVKEGGTVDCAIAYELDDTTTPVTLQATRGLFGEELGEQTFEIA